MSSPAKQVHEEIYLSVRGDLALPSVPRCLVHRGRDIIIVAPDQEEGSATARWRHEVAADESDHRAFQRRLR